jgi:hypothetical protein
MTTTSTSMRVAGHAKRAMSALRFSAFAGVAALAATACAPLNPRVGYCTFPACDAARDRVVEERMKRADASDATDGVVLYLDALPEGIRERARPEGVPPFSSRVVPWGPPRRRRVLAVDEGYDHAFLGSVTVAANADIQLMSLFVFPDYATAWHKPYCYPQTVLTWLTLTFWAFMPPAYPCWGAIGADEAGAAARLRAAAVAARGDAAIAEVARWPNGEGVGIIAMMGVVVRLDPRVRAESAAKVR